MNNLNSIWANLIVEELVRSGVDHFCITPGSRSTPFVIAAARHPKAQCVVCLDERASGYYALGYAKAVLKPAVVITTSGTAVSNLLPAVTEAYMSKIPMLLLTADRPDELNDTGANQTLHQSAIFTDYVRWCHSLPCPNESFPAESVLTSVDQAVFRSQSVPAGPVHLNCRFREPLEPCDDNPDDIYLSKINPWLKTGAPFTSYHPARMLLNKSALAAVVKEIEKADRGLVVIGEIQSPIEREKVLSLAEQLKWPLYADITSGVRLTHGSTNSIRYFDQQLLSSQFKHALTPSVVLHFGGRTTSKRLDQFFDECRPETYIVIQASPERYDRVHAVTMRLQADLSESAEQISEKISTKRETSYSKLYSDLSTQTDALIDHMIEENQQLSEPFIARHLSSSIPDGTSLFLSNSMPIRDMDLYGVNNRQLLHPSANRGVSGIDGILSSAAGMTAGRQSLTTLIIGDMALFYDLNALALLSSQALAIIIVVINNQGGGIFDFLPVSQHKDILEKYFVGKHDFHFSGICASFRIPHTEVRTKEAFVQAYAKAIEKQVPAVIEVSTDRKTNLKLRRSIKSEIIEILEQSIKR
jgi:2-succinyl-5-enolpyruvyl-6-hydroxy-3-cyclohexene-1-carboxylate synthase